MGSPKVFISYSHDSPEHIKWVEQLASKMRELGVDATFDGWELKGGDDIPAFMERQLGNADYVIVVCTQKYSKKANEGVGGVGYEKMILTAELLSKVETRKLIPIMRNNPDFTAPTFLKTKLWIDFTDGFSHSSSLEKLLTSLGISPSKKPALGRRTNTDLNDEDDSWAIKLLESELAMSSTVDPVNSNIKSKPTILDENLSLSSSERDELDFLSDADEASTKLDLARAYIDMGDRDGAVDILNEVLIEGSDIQIEEAGDLMQKALNNK